MMLSEAFHRLAAEEAQHADKRVSALRSLQSTVCFMQTGAHPDDETSGLLAYLARKHGVHLAYACATRGEGGQNVLGAERGDDLATIRVREMELAAQSLGCGLHWLSEGFGDPIRDWRFSKSGEETLEKWGYQRTLERMVHVIRTEQPDIMCPTFLDVGGQHGHHRAMTRIAREAYEIAADPGAFPRHLDAGLQPWAVSKFYLPAWSGAGGSYDDDTPPRPATVHHDIGAADQATGVPYARIGEWSRRFHATQGMGEWIEAGTMSRPLHLAASRIGPAGEVEACVLDGLPLTLADWAQGEGRFAGALRGVQSCVDTAIASVSRDERALALGLIRVREILAAAAPMAPGLRQKLRRTEAALDCAVSGYSPGARRQDQSGPSHVPDLAVFGRDIVVNRRRPAGEREITIVAEPGAVAGAFALNPDGAVVLGTPLKSWDGFETIALPVAIDPKQLNERYCGTLMCGGAPVIDFRRLSYDHTGPLTRRTEVMIRAQPIDVDIAPGTTVAYVGAGFDVIDEHLARLGIACTSFSFGPQTIDWHEGFLHRSLTDVSTILIGIRAFSARDDLVAAIPRLHDFVRNGGHLVTLYHAPRDRFAGVPLARLEIGSPSVRWRVTREDAPVTVLAGQHPLLTGPNTIGPQDWIGWTKERGLYLASSWDGAYTPLVAMSDPGEAPLSGALLTGRFGKGRHTHCALALHTELDALVPGAFRLLANLVQPA